MELKNKIIREEFFPFLVTNGFDQLGILLWVDNGNYIKVILKSNFNPC
jgi:regulation of enolase protein 1 (concanavalin A-like superfamily)